MNKISKKILASVAGILAIFVFAIILMPARIYAAGGSNYNFDTFSGFTATHVAPSPIPAPVYYPVYPTPVYTPVYNTPVYAPVYIPPPAPTPIVYSRTVNPKVAVVRTAPRTVAIATTIPPQVTVSATPDNSNLAANALFGSNGFLPSGLIQWILFAIFILIVVVLARVVFGAKRKYESTPLKHP
jgi:hypothetical protein